MRPLDDDAGADAPLRIALLSYRSAPHSGGQGVYLRHLSRELVALGHDVEVLSGPPYPELDPRVRLTRLASLDLYRQPDPFRLPRWAERQAWIDVVELAVMLTGGFPEPLAFSLRAAQELRRRTAAGEPLPDVVHDNQTLGYGLLQVQRAGLPVLATVHHPITVDRRLGLAQAATRRQRMSQRRWYGFLAMQGRVARRLPALLTVSQSSGDDIVRDFGVAPARLRVVPVGVEADVFRHRAGPASAVASWRRPARSTRSRGSSRCSRPSPRCAPSATSSSWSSGGPLPVVPPLGRWIGWG